jgi:hypothetical protein
MTMMIMMITYNTPLKLHRRDQAETNTLLTSTAEPADLISRKVTVFHCMCASQEEIAKKKCQGICKESNLDR